MFIPDLHIPQQRSNLEDYQDVLLDKDSIKSWLLSRDRNKQNDLLIMLEKINRVKCDPDVRMTLMIELDKEIEKEVYVLLKKTSSVIFPIHEEHLSLINTLQQLLLESSVAYQIIIHDITSDRDYIDQYIGGLLPESLYMALSYLSRLLVERFQFYFSEPVYSWYELNQFYLLAERIGFEDEIIREQTSIKNKYLQIATLKVLNPYRLMHLEARNIYQLMSNWVEYCDIVGYSQAYPEGNFVVNLLSDKSPHYVSKKELSKKKQIKEGYSQQLEDRVITTGELKIFLDAQLAEINENKQHQSYSYQVRMHNEMLQRLDSEMSSHEERLDERFPVAKKIKLVSGLRSCHHFISAKKEFAPQNEVDAQLEKQQESPATSELEIALITPLQEQDLLAKDNPMDELQKVNPFLDELSIVGDEWEHIYASSIVNANIDASQQKQQLFLEEEVWKQRNESANGMLLVGNAIEMPIAVGMLIAYRLEIEKMYSLAIVKWLRVNPRKGIAIGIEQLAVQSRAVAVKGKKGVGSGGQFQRSLLILDKNHAKTCQGNKFCLIVPPGIYDTGSILEIWHNHSLDTIKISQVLVATSSFDQVAFELIVTDELQI
jgi:hypothetical protein